MSGPTSGDDLNPEPDPLNPEPAPTYLEMRDRVFNLTPEPFASLELPPGTPLAAVMEFWVRTMTVTLVSVVDDSTSLYFSTGGGLLGLQKHDQVGLATAAFLIEARKLAEQMTPDANRPLPQRNQVRLYLIDDAGCRSLTVPADLLRRQPDHPAAAMEGAGQAVITAARQADTTAE